jgi:hypothetical protein
MVGALFVGIAYQPFVLMLIGVQNGLWSYLKRTEPKLAGRIATRRMVAGGTPALAG